MPRFSIVPRSRKFYDLFEQAAANLEDASRALLELLSEWDDVTGRVRRIRDLEHEGDHLTHQIMSQLHTTFVTPLDREDIAQIASSIDDVVDFIDAAAAAMHLYKISRPTPSAVELGRITVRCAEEVRQAFALLGEQRRLKDILPHLVEINRLENEADDVLRMALAELFDNSVDVHNIIKWREIYEQLESASDRAEDIANVLEGIVLKHA